MKPSILSDQIRQGLENYLRTTFQITTPHFSNILDEFLDHEQEQLIKGPYLSFKLNFVKTELQENFFDHIEFPYDKAHLHQKKAFKRLTGQNLQPTLIATGTGSGKTEAFLLPILDYCADHKNDPGIKAIFIYPMNALANDQAKRIAKYINENQATRNQIRAGLYIGRGRFKSAVEHSSMGADHIITSHHRLQDDPPDILLTNYKMLDYLLIRPRDARIWNKNSAETLRSLVVDELHTFDGAQGTDLACLIRRLKARLNIPEGHLCPVGTSATLGDEEDFDHLLEYAGKIFDTNFPDNSVLTEHRISTRQYFQNLTTKKTGLPDPEIDEISPDDFSSPDQYLNRQVELWTGQKLLEKDPSGLKLGEWIQQHILFKQLLNISDGKPILVLELLEELSKMHTEFNSENWRKNELLLNSYLALISSAKVKDGGLVKPLLDVNQQLWLREMRRMVASVGENPRLRYSHDLTKEQLDKYLPMIVCRDCGHTGWGATYRESTQKVNTDLNTFYQAFFKSRPDLVFLFPSDSDDDIDKSQKRKLCTECFRLHKMRTEECKSCLSGDNLFKVHKYQEIKQNDNYNVAIKDCPRCGSHNSLVIVGARSATLSAVSVSQFFASPYSGKIDDKRLLAFSDSVQDASHRSGFFTGRTYQFNLRGAIQQFLNSTNWQGTLAELPVALNSYYQGRFDTTEKFIAQFIAPDMQWLEGYENLIENNALPKQSDLLDLVRKRVSWEVYKEYGHRSLIGRTLEKSGSSLVYMDESQLKNAVKEIAERLQEEVGELRDVTQNQVQLLLLGIIYNLRTKGGIYHPFLEKYIRNWGNPYTVKNVPYMPYWSKRSRTPLFLTNKKNVERFQKILSPKRITWHKRWADKIFSSDQLYTGDYINAIYDIVIRGLEKHNIFKVHQIESDKVWSIPGHNLKISKNIIQYQCDKCGHRLQSTLQEQEYWENAPCIQHNCLGHYQIQERKEHYYRNLYANGHIKRIRSEEHTGLLDKKKREVVENRFENQEYPWYPNLLSATPTLEMGINIGDLNSVFLCSIPPDQSNYIQRIGRAGRKSGASFNLAVAEAIPHDLYFYSEPLNMIDGNIKTPGCFLDAVEVLIRQFFAYAMDSYVKAYQKKSNINRKLGQNLKAFSREDHESFPHKFIDYLNRNQKSLYQDFIKLFEGKITEETKSSLWEHIAGSENYQNYLMGRFQEMLNFKQNELDDLKKQRKDIKNEIRNRENNPVRPKNHEKIIKNLKKELVALSRFIRSIDRNNIFQTLTNEGFIPNYTFPESGIKLKSIIYKKIDEEYYTQEFEYVRPASAGIKEFAPDNTFYVEGRKIDIDQVNINLSTKEEWRFCPSCHHTRRVPETDEKVEPRCPECGDPQWSDADQVHEVLELKQVTATNSNKKSLSWDENEVRDPKFYVKNMLVQIDYSGNNIRSAFKINTDNVPFGFEFINKVRLLDINFGQQQNHSEVKNIAGQEVPATGFTICSQCGWVADDKGKIRHTFSCPNRDKDKNGEEFFYLFRELKSEALRILLPSAAFEINSAEHHSFNAALYLGLQEFFGGNIDHLQTTYMQERSHEEGSRRHFLVLYDTVPGGTGYLKQLLEDKNNLKQVFENALYKLRTCKCRTEDKPGCYECIYAYRHSYKMANISSPLAMEILTNIIEQWDTIEEVETIKVVSTNQHIQSQLEEKFIKTLNQTYLNDKRSYLIKDQIHGKSGWRWNWGDEIYRIEPQVRLDDHANMESHAVADFVIWPFQTSKVKKSQQKPVAIFTDGYKYHNQNVDDDFEKRCKIINNSQFLVWNITWNDLDRDQPVEKGLLEINAARLKKFIETNVADSTIRYSMINNLSVWQQGNGLKSLLAYLENPDQMLWSLLVNFISLNIHGSQAIPEDSTFEKYMDDLIQKADNIHPLWNNGLQNSNGNFFQKGQLYNDVESQNRLGYLFTIDKNELQTRGQKIQNGIALLKLWDKDADVAGDGFKKVWEAFLHHANLLQFIDSLYVVTTRGIENHRYMDWATLTASGQFDESKSGSMPDDFELIDESLIPFVNDLPAQILNMASVGFELVNQNSKVVAEAELAWGQQKIAILGEWQMPFKSEFVSRDWSVFTISQAVDHSGKILEKFED